MITTRSFKSRYQEGSFERVTRANGPEVWVYRWRESTYTGKRVQRKKTIGSVKQYPREADAKRAVENLRAEINAKDELPGKMSVELAWGHFQDNELRDPAVDRSPTTINGYLDYFKNHILPAWGKVPIDDVKPVAVEKWLRGLKLANGSKAKIRNHMSALFSHLIRHELYTRSNPITPVRQSAVPVRDPEVLTLEEMKAILANLDSGAVRTMVCTVAITALRRSELLGLRWEDLDFKQLLFHLRRGIVGKDHTKLKSNASRKPVPMHPELVRVLQEWREQTPYRADDDWVFASPYTNGKRPYWPDSALKDHVRPAVVRAGIKKLVGWHSFRHSLATFLGQQGEDIKVVQELLRHANPRITQGIYQHASQDAKRSALGKMSGLFLTPPQN